jgi:hypothetical protein
MKRIVSFLGIMTVVGLVLVPLAMSTPEYAKKESKACTFCHTAVGKPDLNEAGKYYRDHNFSLAGWDDRKKP